MSGMEPNGVRPDAGAGRDRSLVRIPAVILLLLMAGCSAQHVAASARSACRANPQQCTDPDIPAAARPAESRTLGP